ncbi:uncharacterized protein V1516DRAFT_673960 [Lipomyces oligophaga]|uniref:uncharacterized protein n=1 Tax=Lipomyces oligophaga TaxID=45792 RepID=UPI0034CF927C
MVQVSLTVGKLDASIAVLLTSDHHLIEFPSILLPSAAQAGSIVTINCNQDLEAEKKEEEKFSALQEQIYELYGKRSPIRPHLRLRNATQTSIVLEWDSLDLATAELKSLSLFRNNTRIGKIPSPMTNTSTKLSGLAIDTAYTFHLELVTSAGTYSSDKVTVRTHKMTDLSGITCCVGVVSDDDRAILEETVARIGAKPLQDRVRIDTTHFICVEGVGPQWERAMDTNIPVVRPEWLRACESEGRLVGVRSYYLNADPSQQQPLRQLASQTRSGSVAIPKKQPPSVSPSELAESSPATVPLGPESAHVEEKHVVDSVKTELTENILEEDPKSEPEVEINEKAVQSVEEEEDVEPIEKASSEESESKTITAADMEGQDQTVEEVDGTVEDVSGDIGNSRTSGDVATGLGRDDMSMKTAQESVDDFEDAQTSITDEEEEQPAEDKKFDEVIL